MNGEKWVQRLRRHFQDVAAAISRTTESSDVDHVRSAAHAFQQFLRTSPAPWPRVNALAWAVGDSLQEMAEMPVRQFISEGSELVTRFEQQSRALMVAMADAAFGASGRPRPRRRKRRAA